METLKKEFYTPEELAVKLKVTLRTIHKHTYAGDIPGQVRVFGQWRYYAKVIDEALKNGSLGSGQIKKKKKNEDE